MHISSILLFLPIRSIVLFYLYMNVPINEKNVKLFKSLITLGRKHKTNVFISSVLIKSCVDEVNE
jgi:hypothetical protein